MKKQVQIASYAIQFSPKQIECDCIQSFLSSYITQTHPIQYTSMPISKKLFILGKQQIASNLNFNSIPNPEQHRVGGGGKVYRGKKRLRM